MIATMSQNDVRVLNYVSSTYRNLNGFDHTIFNLDESDLKSTLHTIKACCRKDEGISYLLSVSVNKY